MIKKTKENNIPLLYDVDVVVIGASLTGLAVADMSAQNGMSVLVIESDTFLGYEITRWQRPWFAWSFENAELISKWFPIENNFSDYKEGEIIPLHMDTFKKNLEHKMLESNVKLLYATYVIDSIKEDNDWKLIVGNKTGKQAIIASRIIDTTESSAFFFWAKNDVVSRTLEFTGVSNKYKSIYELPETLGVQNNEIRVFPGSFGLNHVYIDIPIKINCAKNRDVTNDTKVEFIAREKSLEVAEYLVNNVSDFSKAKIGFGSLQVARQMDVSPVARLKQGLEIGEKVLDGNKDLRYKPSSNNTLIITAKSDVLVVGAGTSGCTASIAASRDGVKTYLVESNSALGGTGTVGGVNRYWFGNREGYTAQIDEEVKAISQKLNYSPKFNVWSEHDEWNIEIKSFVLFKMCIDAGVNVLLRAIGVGVKTKNGKIVGIEFATPYGILTVKSQVTLDGTGDGDIAVLAGANYIYGNKRDRMPLWFSLAQYKEPSVPLNNFSSSIDIGDICDYTRCVIEGRMRGNELFDHGSYLAPRESRHIIGDYMLRLKDMFLLEHFEDTINVCFSNYDPKGRFMADVVHFGLLPPNLNIEIPFRALLPLGLNNMLVVGKAISVSHEAFPSIRMQSDLQNLGGAAGHAAALAVSSDLPLREIDMNKLQQKLKEIGILPNEYFSKKTIKSEESLEKVIDSIDENEPFEWLEMDMKVALKEVSPIAVLVYADSSKVVPLLREKYKKTSGKKKIIFARLLLWHGKDDRLADVIQEIMNSFANEYPLPLRKGSTRFCQMIPDHGLMPEPAYLLYSLSRAQNKVIMEVFGELVERIIKTERDYYDIELGIFHYIDCVAYVAERLVFPEFVPLLEKLLTLKEFENVICEIGVDSDILNERLAYLKLCLARALARCGSKTGLLMLVEFLSDCRATIARSSLDELKNITGLALELNLDEWKEAVDAVDDKITPVPWTDTID